MAERLLLLLFSFSWAKRAPTVPETLACEGVDWDAGVSGPRCFGCKNHSASWFRKCDCFLNKDIRPKSRATVSSPTGGNKAANRLPLLTTQISLVNDMKFFL